MARLEQMHSAMRASLLAMECPVFDSHAWVTGPPLHQRRVALVSTAGLHRRDDRPFACDLWQSPGHRGRLPRHSR